MSRPPPSRRATEPFSPFACAQPNDIEISPIHGEILPSLGAAAQPHICARGCLTQFRLRFYQSDNGDNQNNFVSFYPAGTTTPANEPVLAVSY
jgi:hypothetical protein